MDLRKDILIFPAQQLEIFLTHFRNHLSHKTIYLVGLTVGIPGQMETDSSDQVTPYRLSSQA